MKLAEWCKMNGVDPTHPTTEKGAVSIILDDINLSSGLYVLDDYVVSSVCGIVYWLVPKSRPKFGKLMIGQKFRFIGGRETFIKIDDEHAAVLSKPHLVDYVSPYYTCCLEY